MRESSRYIVGGLEDGVYQYEAITPVNGGVETIRGEFVVRDLALETIRLTADFELLRELADRNGGNFHTMDDTDNLLREFGEKEARGVIYSTEKYLPAINLLWILLLLIGMVSLEWGIRKYHGSY